MKKTVFAIIVATIMMSSCSNNAAVGTYVGAQFGTILGSAIGGIIGGPRGSDIGTVIGMAGGAAIGAAVGQAADDKEEMENRRQQQADADVYDPRCEPMQPNNDSAYSVDTPGNNDVIDFDGQGPKEMPQTDSYQPKAEPTLDIRKIRISYAGMDEVVCAGDECTIQFEIMNCSNETVYDVQPLVIDESNNKHIHISPNLHVERISPNAGIRYTATILADRKLKNGTATIRVGAAIGNQEVKEGGKTLTITTRRRR